MRGPRYAIAPEGIKKRRPIDIGTCRTATHQGNLLMRHYAFDHASDTADVMHGARHGHRATPTRERLAPVAYKP
jgi:hypothetical protein